MKLYRFPSYAFRKSRSIIALYRKMLFVVIIFIFTLALSYYVLFPIYWPIAVLMVMISFFCVFRNEDRKYIKEEIRRAILGVTGEEKVINVLKNLSDEYLYVTNYPIAGLGDVDGILLGPKGFILIEVKTWLGQFMIIGGEWFKKFGDILKLHKNPFTQARSQRDHLQKLFNKIGLHVTIRPMIVLVDGKFDIRGKTGIWTETDQKLIKYIEELSDNSIIDSQREAILRVLNVP